MLLYCFILPIPPSVTHLIVQSIVLYCICIGIQHNALSTLVNGDA